MFLFIFFFLIFNIIVLFFLNDVKYLIIYILSYIQPFTYFSEIFYSADFIYFESIEKFLNEMLIIWQGFDNYKIALVIIAGFMLFLVLVNLIIYFFLIFSIIVLFFLKDIKYLIIYMFSYIQSFIYFSGIFYSTDFIYFENIEKILNEMFIIGQMLYNYGIILIIIAGLLLLLFLVGSIISSLVFKKVRLNNVNFGCLSRTSNFISFFK